VEAMLASDLQRLLLQDWLASSPLLLYRYCQWLVVVAEVAVCLTCHKPGLEELYNLLVRFLHTFCSSLRC
jgi:hypothetical protein